MKFMVLINQNGNKEWINSIEAKNKKEAIENVEILVKGSKAITALKIIKRKVK